MVQETSVEKYKELERAGKISESQRVVLEALKNFGPSTDSELAQFLGEEDPVNSKKFRPRRNELVEKGLVVSRGKIRCEVSGGSAIVWDLADNVEGKGGNQLGCLSEVELKNVFKKLIKSNSFQKKKIRDWINKKLGEENE